MRCLLIAVGSLALSGAAIAQEEAPPPGAVDTSVNLAGLVGTYDVTIGVPANDCAPRHAGEVKGQVRATMGRRGLLLHVDELQSIFRSPITVKLQSGSQAFTSSALLRTGGRVTATVDGNFDPATSSFLAAFKSDMAHCEVTGSVQGQKAAAAQ